MFGKSRFIILLLLLAYFNTALSQAITITDKKPTSILSAVMEQQVDSSHISTPEEILQSNHFVRSNGAIPIFQNNIKSAWFRFTVQDQSSSSRLFLDIAFPNLSEVSLYRIDSGKAVLIGQEGNDLLRTQTVAGSPNIILNLQIKNGTAQQYLLHVCSRHPIIVPATIVSYDALHESINFQTVVTGVYLGVLMVMLLYNLFLFFATKDNNYLFYIIYIFFLNFKFNKKKK